MTELRSDLCRKGSASLPAYIYQTWPMLFTLQTVIFRDPWYESPETTGGCYLDHNPLRAI